MTYRKRITFWWQFWPHPGSVSRLALVLRPACSLWTSLMDRISRTWRGKGRFRLWVPSPVFGSKKRRTNPRARHHSAPCAAETPSGLGPQEALTTDKSIKGLLTPLTHPPLIHYPSFLTFILVGKGFSKTTFSLQQIWPHVIKVRHGYKAPQI